MKKLNLKKIKEPEFIYHISLNGLLYFKVIMLLIVMISEWLLDIVLISWAFTLLVPIWLAIIFGIIIGGLFTFPFREYYTDYTITKLYYWLAFRKDKLMMSLMEKVEEK